MDRIDNHVLFNILKRLSPEDVFSCIFLCKRWYRLINHPHFIKQHLQLHRQHGFLIQTVTDSETPHDTRVAFTTKEGQFFEKKIDCIGNWGVAATCNGLLLLTEWTRYPMLLRITNPVTKFTISLPPIYPIGNHYSFSLAHVPSTGSYCVVYVYTCDESIDSKNVEFQILEIRVGQDLQGLQWEKIPSEVEIYDFNFEKGQAGLYLDRGMLVWNLGLRSHCVAMDFNALTIYRLPLPEAVNNNSDRFYLVNKGGSLALIDYPTDDGAILRVLCLDSDDNRWTVWCISVSPLRDLLDADVAAIVPIYISDEGNEMIFLWSNRFFECSSRTGEMREIPMEGTWCMSCSTHMESLVSLKCIES